MVTCEGAVAKDEEGGDGRVARPVPLGVRCSQGSGQARRSCRRGTGRGGARAVVDRERSFVRERSVRGWGLRIREEK